MNLGLAYLVLALVTEYILPRRRRRHRAAGADRSAAGAQGPRTYPHRRS